MCSIHMVIVWTCTVASYSMYSTHKCHSIKCNRWYLNFLIVYTVNYDNFFDFGVNVGDARENRILSGSSLPINLSTPIQLFGRTQHTVLVSQLCILLLTYRDYSWWWVTSSPGHSHILSHSRGEKSGEGLGSKLCHGPEMVDSVSTNRVHITY